MDSASPDERLERIERLERLVEGLAGEVRALRREMRIASSGGETAGGTHPAAPAAPAARERPTPAFGPPAGWVPLPDRRPVAGFSGSAPDALRSTLDAPAPDALRPTRAAGSPTHAVRSFWSTDDVERVVGRYGMLALATITGLAAVGTFIGWAASRARIGPEARLGLGVVLAIALAAFGLRMRPRERSFGAVLLGLALAVAHVCAWGAGPAVLDLVPSPVTLTLTLLASGALAAFAHRENDEPLWCVGFGGAAIAPFVTSSGSEGPLALTLYGGAVMLLGCWALRGREWPIAGRVLTLAGFTYTFSLVAAPESTGAPLMALGLASVVAGAGVIPFTGLAMRRSRLRGFGLMMAIAAVDVGSGGAAVAAPHVVAIVLAFAAWAAFIDVTAALPAGSLLDGLAGEGSGVWDLIDATVIPLLFLAALIDGIAAPWRIGMAATFAGLVMLGVAWRRPMSPLRDAAALTVSAAALLAAWWFGDGADDWRIAVMAIPAVLFLGLRTRLAARPWLPVAAVTLIVCSFASLEQLGRRTAYFYVPFGTTASFIALAIAAAWVVAWLIATDQRRLLAIAAWTWAFAWVHQELAHAISRTTSTLLIISYYAITSVVLVGIGRNRSNPVLRHVGLVLALLAAASAVRGAISLRSVWAQIAGYLVASVFLLGIAWWYRQRGEEGGEG